MHRAFFAPNAGDDRYKKAYDAIIVAASTVAVLIANVTYVGELQVATSWKNMYALMKWTLSAFPFAFP